VTAQLLDGKAVVADIRVGLAQRVAHMSARGLAAAGPTAATGRAPCCWPTWSRRRGV